MNNSDPLYQLCQLLRGRPIEALDWQQIIRVANQALITPRLDDCLDHTEAPSEVRSFVQEVVRRNRDRNARLYDQLVTAAAALNAVGLEPLVIKGGACLARSGGRGSSIISDLDLVVAPGEIDAALAALKGAGFSILTQYADVNLHGLAELGRPEDVGQIDLHQRPPGPASFVSGPEFLCGEQLRVGASAVRVPAPHMHIYLQALHDQLQDGAYWRGGFDLRHAWDIADLIRTEPGVDWAALDLLPPTRLTVHALHAQLLACHTLTGADIPLTARGRRASLHARRQWLQYRMPLLRIPLAALTILSEAPNIARHRRSDGLRRKGAGLPPYRRRLAPSLGRLYEILTDARRGGQV